MAATCVVGCGRAGSTIQSVRVGGRPYDIAIDATSVWVANFDDDSVTRIERNTGRVVATIRVPASPDGLLSTADAVLVTSTAANVVATISKSSGEVLATRAPIPSDSLVGSAATWVGGLPADRVSAVDADGTVRTTTEIPGAAWTVSARDRVWVGSVTNRSIFELNANSGVATREVSLPHSPWRLAISQDDLWVTDYDAGRVMKIDAPSGRLMDDIAVGHHAKGLAVDSRGLVWVAVQKAGPVASILQRVGVRARDGELVALDPSTDKIVRRVPLPGVVPGALAVWGRFAWVADVDGDRVVKADLMNAHS